MKSNFFKYIFILFVVAIIIFAIYMIYFNEEKVENEILQSQVEEVIEIKELKLGISNFDTINPLLSNNKEVLNIGKLIFEPLITIDEKYQAQLCLATECSKTSDTSYVIKIDHNKKWQDGTALTAKDIQFTIDRLKEGKSVYSYQVEKVISVEVLDTSTIKINLSEEVPFFEYHLSFPILPNHYYVGEDFNISTKIPIGTGMFQIASMDENYIILNKNKTWWNITEADSKIETIQIKKYTEIGELYNSFKLGNIDIFTTSNTNLEQYIGTIGYAKRELKGRKFDYLAFNCQDDILQDKEVRKAIKLAIDKNNIVSSIYNNQAYVSHFPLDYGNYLCDEASITYENNIEEAKKVLLQAGWEYKNNRWQKVQNYQTKRLNFTLTVNTNEAERVAVAENIKVQLEQIGIKITIQKVSDASYQSILANKKYDMLLTGVYNGYSPNVTTFFGLNNLQNYNNEEMNHLLAEVKTITDTNLLKEKYQKIMQIYQEEQPFISLYRNKNTIVKSQNLAGEVTGNNFFSYYQLEKWYTI